MVKKILALAIVMSIAASFAAIRGERISKLAPLRNDRADNSKAVTWTVTQSGTFDKSANGYGWYQGYNRKIQTNFDPVTGPMFGTVYRQLADTGSGTIGGMIGEWETSTFNAYAQTIYDSSPYQGGAVGNPGGRYPNAADFINGYMFGVFNDYDLTTGGEVSQAMYAVCDATMGWDLSMWSECRRVEAVEGGATPPGAWTGMSDVVYNPEDGYYYWTMNWSDGLAYDSPYSFVVGRSDDPANMDSWEWTDYNEYNFDCTTEDGVTDMSGKWHVSYAKDIYGNGTGYGIAVAMFLDSTYELFDLEGNQIDESYYPRLGYVYTTNWGADWSTGDFKPNWKTPNDEGTNLFAADITKLFPWYNTVVTGDSIGVDGDGNAIYEEIPLNLPYMTWNIGAVTTEENIVHVIVRLAAGTTEADYIYYTNDTDVVAGFYDVVGEITESGVNWFRASYIGAFMGIDNGDVEWKYSNGNDHSIGYAGNGVVYATWIDRPETRYIVNPNTDPNKDYICDSYFTYSPDHGATWDINKTVVADGYSLYYAANITKTNALQDEGFNVATHGYNVAPNMTVYAACQYYDPANPLPDPVVDYFDYQQFLKVWKIKGTPTGIETEDVSMVKDFTLFQNYPNPFNPATEIKFALQNESNVKLSVFNIKGELVTHLKNEKMAKGMHSVNFDAASMNSGVYFYKLDVNGRTETKKMVLTK